MSTQTPFDNYAAYYDSHFTYSKIGRLQRNSVWNHLNTVPREKKTTPHRIPLSILEINCGTGEDALRFGKAGHVVIATDISNQMINIANQKISDANLNSCVRLECCEFNNLSFKYKAAEFDIIFSNFGGLNCIDEGTLKETLVKLNTLLKPGGRIIFVVMGTHCIWEVVYFIVKFQFKKAFRRISGRGTEATIKKSILKTYYYSPRKIKRLISSYLQHETQKPIGLFVPPSYLEPFFKNKDRLLKFLNQLESIFGQFSIFANLADHYLIQFYKK